MLNKILTKIIGNVALEWEQGQVIDSGSPTLTAHITVGHSELKVIVTKSEHYPDYPSAFLETREPLALRRSFIVQVLGDEGKDNLFQQCVSEKEFPKEFRLIEIFWDDVDKVWKNRKTTRREHFTNWLNN